jgi:hypothetical protein
MDFCRKKIDRDMAYCVQSQKKKKDFRARASVDPPRYGSETKDFFFLALWTMLAMLGIQQ